MIEFILEYNNNPENRLLTYISDEHSFNMEPIVNNVDIELILNKLSLSVVNNKIIQLWGFCGLSSSMKSNFNVPKYKKGILKVKHNLKHGFAYDITNKNLPIHVNTQTGWVCIGTEQGNGDAVEFINNCVAVVNKKGRLIALWLKPKSLPEV